MNRRHRLGLLIGLAGIVLLLLSAGSVYWTSRPSYCRTCHVIEPYYRSWRMSAHADVPCGRCHWDAGVRGTLRAKLAALDELVRSLRGDWKEIQAQIPDQRCMNCHTTPEEMVLYRGMPFEHFQHLSLTSGGLQLSCTACHYQPDEPFANTHIPAPPEPCYQCHLGNHAFPRLYDCVSCHGESLRLKPSTSRFSHAPILADAIPCENCHENSVEEQGKVASSACSVCHTRDETDLTRWDAVELHRKHLHGKGQTACENCHARIDHSLN